MISTWRLLSSSLAFFLMGSALGATPRESAQPRSAVNSIYHGRQTGTGSGATWLDPSSRQQLSRSLIALWAKADAAAKRRGDEVGPIDWDVTTNSQGMEVKSFTVAEERRDAKRAVVVATLVPDNWVTKSPDENIIRYNFILERGRWKIDDVRSGRDGAGWSLRDLLARSLR